MKYSEFKIQNLLIWFITHLSNQYVWYMFILLAAELTTEKSVVLNSDW